MAAVVAAGIGIAKGTFRRVFVDIRFSKASFCAHARGADATLIGEEANESY